VPLDQTHHPASQTLAPSTQNKMSSQYTGHDKSKQTVQHQEDQLKLFQKQLIGPHELINRNKSSKSQ
jgi:hypothetical protein